VVAFGNQKSEISGQKTGALNLSLAGVGGLPMTSGVIELQNVHNRL
jgi:hypothetical protein